MLGERNQTQDYQLCDSIPMKSWKIQQQGDRKQISGCWGKEEGRAHWGDDIMMAWVITQSVQWSKKNQLIAHLNSVNFTACKPYLNKVY